MERLNLVHSHLREKMDHEKTSEWPYLRPEEREEYQKSSFQSSPSPEGPRKACGRFLNGRPFCIRWKPSFPINPSKVDRSSLETFLDDFTDSSDHILALKHKDLSSSRKTVTEMDVKSDTDEILQLVKDQKFSYIIVDTPQYFSDTDKTQIEQLFEQIGDFSDAIRAVCVDAVQEIANTDVIFSGKEVLADQKVVVNEEYTKKEVNGDKIRYEKP